MNELKLLFERAGADLAVRVVAPGGAGAGGAQPIQLFLTDDDAEDLRWRT